MPSKLKTFLSILLVLILVMTFHYLNWLKPVENFFRELVMPGSKAMYDLNIKIKDSNENFKDVNDLKLAYKKIKEDYINNQVDIGKMQLLESENTELRTQLNYLSQKKLKTIGADVVGKNIEPLASTLVLNRGVKDGIKEGQSVIVENGILVGIIARAEDHQSVVRLINDNQSKIAGTIISRDKSIGLIEGGFGISVSMDFIPQNEDIKVGDVIVTSGLQTNIPRGLSIGTVEAVEKEAYQPFQQAIISPFAALDKISAVSVIMEF